MNLETVVLDAAPEPAPTRAGVAGWLAAALLFWLGLVAGHALLEATPFPPLRFGDDPEIGARLQLLEEEREHVQVLFLGTSLTAWGVDPVIVEKGLSSGGPPRRVLNLGFEAAHRLEVERLLERIAEMALPKLEVVVIEGNYRPLEMALAATDRALAVHDRRGVREAISYPQIEGRRRLLPAVFGLDGVGVHAATGLLRYLGLGRAAAVLVPEHGQRQREEALTTLRSRRGHLPRPPQTEDEFERLLHVLLAGNVDRLRAQRKFRGQRRSLHQGYADFLTRQLERIRALGARPVLLIPPGVMRLPEIWAVRQSADDGDLGAVDVLDYWLDRGPEELYDPDLWRDVFHYNEAGARLYSRRLGEDLSALLSGSP